MPLLRIETNVPKETIPPNFLLEFTEVIAKTLGKPIEYCSVAVIPGMQISFAGTNEPCAFITLMSIGKLGIAENKVHAKVIFDKIQKDLGISPNRAYISFVDPPTSEVGYNGTTFHEILGGKLTFS